MEMRFRKFKFFSYIRHQFGTNTFELMKDFIKLTNQSIMMRLRIKFLKSCNTLQLIPPHLEKCNVSVNNLNLFHDISKKRLKLLMHNHVRMVLRLELDDAYRQLTNNSNRIFKIYKKITRLLPWVVANKFFVYQENISNGKWTKETNRLNKKIEWLTKKRSDSIKKDIKPIKYYYTENTNELRIALNSDISCSKVVNVTPDNFELDKPLKTVHDNWFVNLSKKTIPEEVKLLLQLGEKFSLPLVEKDKEKTIIDFIKCIEKNICKELNDISNQIRNQSIPIIKRLINKPNNSEHNKNLIMSWLKQTKLFAINNPDILFTKADKGNATVAMDLVDYNTKMKEVFSDNNTYTIVKKDPVKKLSSQLRDTLSGWLKKEYIDMHTYRKLLFTDGWLPRAYGLPKLHKTGYPLRVIISSSNSPLYNLSYYLHNILKRSVPEAKSSVGNSFTLVKNLNGKTLDSTHTLASLDVVSLFTNVPIDTIYEAILNRWQLIERETAIPKNEFLLAVKLILESTFFSFDSITYKQIFGTPMGSPLSPIVADLVLQDLETSALKKLPSFIPLYYRYVDDILLAAPVDQLYNILEVFNSFHERLQFTLEISLNNKINFLDLTIVIKNQSILFDRYEKPTSTGRYINYYSQHPWTQKRGIIYGLIDRTILLSHPDYHENNLISVVNTLLNNCFPLSLIFSTINKRIKTLTYKEKGSKDKRSNKNITSFFTIPYVKSISESFLPITTKFGFNISYSIPNTLHSFIKRGKDKINSTSQRDCVYKIKCKNCEDSYVGQTKRQLGTRVKEHMSDIKKKSGLLSVVSNHILDNDHEMDWKGTIILDKEPSYTKRIISEMIYIKRQKRGLNKQSDTDLLSDTYLPIINILPPL